MDRYPKGRRMYGSNGRMCASSSLRREVLYIHNIHILIALHFIRLSAR